MIIGVPKEIKTDEHRVSCVPAGVQSLCEAGHRVLVQAGAGADCGLTDQDYERAGARIVPNPADIFGEAEMIIKVKEPQPPEYPLLRPGQILYTYLHLAASKELTQALKDRQIIGIGYETIQLADGSLPLLTPMSEVAGRMAVQVGAYFLQKQQGGRGVLLSGVPGVPPAEVLILGGGTVGGNAARVAVGLGAQVIVIDSNLERLRYLDSLYRGRLVTLASHRHTISARIRSADLVIGAVLIPGAKAPKLVQRAHLKTMKEGAVIVDVAVDQGGCVETSKPTTHSHPTFVVDGILHYCVANMPGAVARTSSFALANTTLPYALAIANEGLVKAVRKDPALARGVNLYRGEVTYQAVATDLSYTYRPLTELLS